MSVRTNSLARSVEVDQYLDTNGVLFFWDKIKAYVDSNVPEVVGNDPNLCYNAFFCATDWSTLPAINEEKQVLCAYIVGRVPSVNRSILGAIVTSGTVYIVTWRVLEIPTPPVQNGSLIKLKCLNLWKMNEVAWNDISGKPTDLVTTNDMNSAISAATADKITAEQAGTQISTALTSYSTTEQMNAAISSAVSSVYRYAGSVATYANLPTENVSGGDVYNVTDTDMNYAWVQPDTGDGYWDPLGSTFSIEPIPNSVIQEIVDGTYGS